MTDRLQQLEQRVQTQNKRIADLETKHLALLEDLKTVRAELVKTTTPAISPELNRAGQTLYQSRFERWPGSER